MSRPELASVADNDHPTEPAPRPPCLAVLAEDPPASTAALPDPPSEPEPRAQPVRAEPALPVRHGPLLAVCGCCGGAGASTLAYLVALAAARERSEPVLVADTGGTGGGLAYYAGVAAPHTLAEIAERVAAGLSPGRPYAAASESLRVLATGPRFAPACVRAGVELVLEDARDAHSLTVIDCGTLTREADQIVLAKASHIAWVLPATRSGVRRARRMLDAINPPRGRELIVARRDEREPKAALGDLKRIAEERQAPLILVPHLPDLNTGNATNALETAQVSLQAIHGLLQR